MSAKEELIAAALRLAALAERNTDDRNEWQHAIDSVREGCARAMVQPNTCCAGSSTTTSTPQSRRKFATTSRIDR